MGQKNTLRGYQLGEAEPSEYALFEKEVFAAVPRCYHTYYDPYTIVNIFLYV